MTERTFPHLTEPRPDAPIPLSLARAQTIRTALYELAATSGMTREEWAVTDWLDAKIAERRRTR